MSTHHPSTLGCALRASYATIGIVASAAVCFGSLSLLPSENVFSAALEIVLVLAASTTIVIASGQVVHAARALFVVYEVWDNALIVRRLFGVDIVPWCDIDSLVWDRARYVDLGENEPPVCFSNALHIFFKRRPRITIDNCITGWRELGSVTERCVTRVLLPRVVERINRGEECRFGTLTLSDKGVARFGRIVEWHFIETVEIVCPESFELRGRQVPVRFWIGCKVGSIENIRVLLRIVQQYEVKVVIANRVWG